MKWAIAASALILSIAPAAAVEAWGWVLPNVGPPIQARALYRGTDGSLVAQYVSERGASQIVGYYDLSHRKVVGTPAEALGAYTNNEQSKIFLKKHSLTAIPFHGPFGAQVGAHFAIADLSGPKCKFPYDDAFSILRPDGDFRLYLVVWKAPLTHEQADYGCNYVDTPETPKLRTRYRVQGWDFYWDGANKFLLFRDRPWIVRFDAEGHTGFFNSRQDAALIRAEHIAPLVEKMEGKSERESQMLVGKIEEIIRQQLKR